MMPGKNLDVSPAKNNTWTLRYAVVKPDRIFNWLGMMNVTSWVFFPELRKTWWSEDTVATRQRIQQLYIKYFDEVTGHFTALENSLRTEGFHAPVNTCTGLPRDMWLKNVFPPKSVPPENQSDSDNVLFTHTFGGSRVIIAQKLGIDIPCIIYDFTGAFSDAEKITTPAQLKAKFPNSYQTGTPQVFPVARAISHTHINAKNDNVERTARHKVIERIRHELKQEGKI